MSGLGVFVLLQTRAVAQYPDTRHTLSATTRRWLGVYPARPRRAASAAGLLGAFGALAAHFLVDPPYHQRYTDPGMYLIKVGRVPGNDGEAPGAAA